MNFYIQSNYNMAIAIYKYTLLHSFKFRVVRREIFNTQQPICRSKPLGSYRKDAMIKLTTVYTDHVFNQGYHVPFNGLLRQSQTIMWKIAYI